MRRNPPSEPRLSLRHWLQDSLSALVIRAALRLPYDRRVAAMGWFSRSVLGPLAMNRRIRANLAHVAPQLPPAEVRRLCRAVADNFGRSMIELNSGVEFARHAATMPLGGAGLPALEAARAAGRPVILASAHFGNYDAWRGGLSQRGYRVGGLYKPLHNPATNRRYLAVISEIAGPLFARGNAGMAEMVRFLRGGGMLGILTDVHVANGERLDFLGKPALTATSAAKLALKYDALLLPIYATRNPDGLSFTIDVEAPIPHGDPLVMTQALNDSISARVRGAMGQWFWAHRRWKNTGA